MIRLFYLTVTLQVNLNGSGINYFNLVVGSVKRFIDWKQMSFMSMTWIGVEWDFPGIRGQRIISHLGIDHWSLENSTESMIVLENVHPTQSSRL